MPRGAAEAKRHHIPSPSADEVRQVSFSLGKHKDALQSPDAGIWSKVVGQGDDARMVQLIQYALLCFPALPIHGLQGVSRERILGVRAVDLSIGSFTDQRRNRVGLSQGVRVLHRCVCEVCERHGCGALLY